MKPGCGLILFALLAALKLEAVLGWPWWAIFLPAIAEMVLTWLWDVLGFYIEVK